MAGQGIKLFTSGDVLSAAEINGYLMDQSVTRFASTTERNLAFGGNNQPVLSEGRICYIDDTNLIQFYDGTQWQDSAQFVVANGAITSAKIENGTILDIDINATAAIALSKLATTGTLTATTFVGALTGVASFTAEWILGANSSNHYTFTGPGLIGAEDDPTLHLVRGQKYKFTNTMGAHPFRIQSTVNGSTGTAYNDGVTNNDVSNGTLIWDVQFDSPSLLYYQCTSHGSMGGKVYIVDETASMIGTRTVFVQNATPTAIATGDIWFQVVGL